VKPLLARQYEKRRKVAGSDRPSIRVPFEPTPDSYLQQLHVIDNAMPAKILEGIIFGK
jgi:hypothetical protein